MSDIKQYIKRIVVVALIIIFCFILQTAIFSNIVLAGVTPNILICVVATYGFMKGQKKGLIIGFFVGLLLDLFSGFYFGFYAIVYMYIGFLNGFFKKLFYGDDLKLPMILIGTSDVVFGIISYIALYFTRSRYDFMYYLLYIILPEMVYTLLASIFVYYGILAINNLLDKMDKKGSDRIGTY